MTNDTEIEKFIQDNVQWNQLPHSTQQLLGNSVREYEKRILDFSVKNQLRHKGNLIRFVKKNAEEYYDLVLKYSLSKLMVFPYHLIDVYACGLRILPFEYYSTMLQNIMKDEKSYDSLPNFTAADVYRLLNIGRNEFIEMMNETRSYRKLFRRSKTLQEILPQKPVDFQTETWFMLKPGCLLDNDVKQLNQEEKDIIDRLIVFPITCGLLDKRIINSLHSRGLVYFDVPVSDDDYFYVPKLDGFIMNRVQGDFFENLLYKVFVTIDGQTNVKELSEIIGTSNESVKNAISVLCRLGFVKKRTSGLENVQLHPSWQNITPSASMNTSITDETVLTQSISDFTLSLTNDEDDSMETSMTGETSNLTVTSPNAPLNTPFSDTSQRRIAFLFDSSLTAFLMMGNLSSNLKNHAVTLFEVGKLSDNDVENFITELTNINFFAEGEAQRYSEHAKNLMNTIKIIRGLSENGIDLIRGESLMSLDRRGRERIIQKSYRVIISMAPICTEACPFNKIISPHIGSPVVEMASPWFRLFVYDLVKAGPQSIMFPMGTCVNQISFESKRLILSTSGSHEPNIILSDNALSQLNDSLLSSFVIIQEYSDIVDDSEIVNIAFPFLNSEDEHQDPSHFCNHPSVKILQEKLNLDKLCGYITLIAKPKKPITTNQQKTSNLQSTKSAEARESPDILNSANDAEIDKASLFSFRTSLSSTVTKDPRKMKSEKVRLTNEESFEDFVVFDCVFGVPLFDEQLNAQICQRITSLDLIGHNNMENVSFAMAHVVESVQEFVNSHRDKNYQNPWHIDSNCIPLPTFGIQFDSKTGHVNRYETK